MKSLTLADLAPPPVPLRAAAPRRPRLQFFRRIVHLVKLGLMAWALISLGAVAGMSFYHFHGRSDAVLILGEARTVSAPSAEGMASAKDRLAALIEPVGTPTTFRLPASAHPEAAQTSEAVAEPAPIIEARVPRARPSEIITGSISPPPYDPGYAAPARRSRLDPCTALKNLGAPFLFGNRCGRYTHVYPPPPRQFDRVTEAPPQRQYTPQPYQPPTIAAD